ncbi:MAG: iron chelate uptake ABC transporter family permease subunit [Rhodobiaceae bacterium]|nr:iron chelate uptake ABC transporter family permease subunit [Rhodobiaceae bacterium]
MFEEFFLRALLGGMGVALIAGPLGCFVIWRRMAYFGDALAHSALLGVALGFLLSIEPALGVLVACAVLAIAFTFLQKQQRFAADTVLGLLAHSALALGLVVLGFLDQLRIDLMGYLFGDVLALSWNDVTLIYLGAAIVLAGLLTIWRRLLAVTVDPELAQADGIHPLTIRLFFSLLLAVVIALAMQVVGVLLITALLIIPAAAARRFSSTPEQMALLAAGVGALSVALGLWGSFSFDTASGPSIVVAALALFLGANAAAALVARARN